MSSKPKGKSAVPAAQSPMADLDLRAIKIIDLEKPKRVDLFNPVDGVPITDTNGDPMFVMVYSIKSNRVKRAMHEIVGRSSRLQKNYPNRELPIEIQEEMLAETYAAALGDEWHVASMVVDADDNWDGTWAPLNAPCTREMRLAWCRGNDLFYPQLDAAAGDIKGFMKGGGLNFTKKA